MSISGFNHDELLKQFTQQFGPSEHPVQQFFAPGRVNLVGDHTDYTGGFVFPCAIDTGSVLLIRQNSDKRIRFASTNFEFTASVDKSNINVKQGDHWINYPLGVINQFIQRGVAFTEFDTGFDLLFSGNVPNGAGLSSSASIEVVTAFALNELLDCKLSLIELVKMAQAAENEFVGMQCGIMDQFAVAMAQENHAMFLKCDTLDYEHIPLALDKHAIVLANSNQRRELSGSAYNDRVSECERALTLLQQAVSINALGELSEADLVANKSLFKNDEIPYLRAMHVASENARVKNAVNSLEQGDINSFGKLMNASHDSLKDAYHVSSEPLDHLVNAARSQPGVIGSRLTGAGFGGCVVNLLEKSQCDNFIKNVSTSYQEKTDLSAEFYVIAPSAGVRRISNSGSEASTL